MLPLPRLREQPVPQFDIVYPSKALISRSDVADFDLLCNRGYDRVVRLQLVRCDQARGSSYDPGTDPDLAGIEGSEECLQGLIGLLEGVQPVRD